MDELKQRIVQRVLSRLDPASLVQDPSGVELGQRQGQMVLVQELVSAFAASLAEESVELNASQRRHLLEQVVAEVVSREPGKRVVKPPEVRPTVERLVRWGTWDKAVVEYLRACIAAGRSVLVSGDAGAGKTTLLGVMTALIPEGYVVSVGGAARLEGEGEHFVHLHGESAELLDWALWLSPDWLVLDEVTPEMAAGALQAMSAVPTLAALRGPSARAGLGRLVEMALEAAPGLSAQMARRLAAHHVDVVVNVERWSEGLHCVTEVVEVLPDAGVEGDMRIVTLVTRLDETGELAATGAGSAFVMDALLQSLPRVEALPELPLVPVVAEAPPLEAAVPEPEVAAPPVEPAAAKPAPKPEKKGLLAGLFSGWSKVKGPTLETAVSAAARGAAIAATTEMTDYSQTDTPPVVQKMTTYLQGDDLYDVSYAVEEGEEFLGEMGVGLTEVVDEGPPKRVAGFEVWMFDKETLETPTAVLLSEGAYADEELRGRHALRGEVTVAAPGERVVLDTGVLRLEAQVKDVALGEDGLSFERATIELAAWHEKGVGSDAG